MLNPNSPFKRLKFVAKQYGPRSPGVVMDTFFLLSDLAGIEYPKLEAPQAWLWERLAFRFPRDRATGMPSFIKRRQLLWEIGPDAPIDHAMYPAEGEEWDFHDPWASVMADLSKSGLAEQLETMSQRDLMEGFVAKIEELRTEGMFQRYESDPIWPWVARELNRAKKADVKRAGGVPYAYIMLLEDLRGKGSALALWQEQENVDLNRTSAADALQAIEKFEPEIDTEQGEVVYEFEDGWTVQKLASEDQLVQEGEAMQHCVGSYCEEVIDGETTIYSLRDPGGKPHATMEVKDGSSRFEQVQGKQNEPPTPEYQQRVDEFGKEMGIAPATLTPTERTAARHLGEQLAESFWQNDFESIVGRGDACPVDTIEESLIQSYIFPDDSIDSDSDLYEEAEDAVRDSAESMLKSLWEVAMQELDDIIEEVQREAEEHLEEEGDLDDFDYVKVAKSYIWDIGGNDVDAEYIAELALRRLSSRSTGSER